MSSLERRLESLERDVAKLLRLAELELPVVSAAYKRDQTSSRVLSGASSRMHGFGHRWLKERLAVDPIGRLAYGFGLVGAVCCTSDISRQVKRATYVMQCAAAMIEGVTVERWTELHA